MQPEKKLLQSLWRELFQTETSASRHCRREAKRFADESPAAPLLAIAADADRVLEQLPDLSRRFALPESQAARGLGASLSALRELAIDRMVNRERSYRATLLGTRHGIDVIRLIGHCADELGLAALSVWCDDWLDARVPLVEVAEEELAWFASHPAQATRRARPLLG